MTAIHFRRRFFDAGPAPLILALAASALAVPLLLQPALTVAALLAAALVVAVMARPHLATYVLLPTTLLIAGVERGVVIPVLRPNEIVLLLIAGALSARGLILLSTGHRPHLRITVIDVTLLALCLASSVLPLLMMMARSRTIESDDLLYAMNLWRYLGVYVVIRSTIRTERQVKITLWLIMGASSIVAVIGIAQALGLFGLQDILAGLYTPEGDRRLASNRATSTLGSSFAVGDVMVFNLAIAAAWLLQGARHTKTLFCAAVLFVFGAIGSGQFSSLIALVIVVAAVGLITGRLHKLLLVGVPLAAAAGIVLQPVIQRRLAPFQSTRGLPNGWLGRLENLRRFFWPELFRDFNYVFGVRPSARLPAPESWRDWVSIESGHTWLLWNGGIPMALAFVGFAWASLTTTARLARQQSGPLAVAATAAFAAMSVQVLLLTLDIHLILRGAADLTFALLGLALVVPHPASGQSTVRAKALSGEVVSPA
jgi:hypothetical protein